MSLLAAPLPVIKSILFNEPICLIWLIGLAMAWIQRHEHPRVSGLVVVALTFLIVQTVFGTYLDLWVPISLYQQADRLPAWLFKLLAIHEPVQLVMRTVAWLLLLFAMFNWRTPSW